jgi:rhamnosyltransferase subunit B
LYALIQKLQADGQTLRVVAGPHMLGARLTQEHLGTDLVSVYTASSMLRTFVAPTTIAHTYWPRGTPRWLLQWLWKKLDERKLEPMARRHMNEVCQQLGIQPPSAEQSLFGQWIHSTRRGITLYPFCPVSADVAAPIVAGEFPVAAATRTTDGLSAQLQTFLQKGQPPVVITMGSGMQHGASLYARWQEAITAEGMRAILISGDAKQFPAQQPSSVLHEAFAPFADLLPSCLALVHHGGIGNCIQAFSAGIGQIIQPHSHDQFENARCAKATGAALSLHRDATVPAMRRALRKLTQLSGSASAVQARMPADGIARVGDLLQA